MRHDEAWTRLPDLLDDRDDAALLAHVRTCADCQRQLFLLGRVDRVLRVGAAARATAARRRRPWGAMLAASVAVAAVLAVAVLAFPQHERGQRFELRTASGLSVAQAVMGHGDARNASLALTARRLPTGDVQMFVLWASDASSSMQVGRFMVDRSGGCRVRFNLPTSHAWNRFWISPPGNAAAVVAST